MSEKNIFLAIKDEKSSLRSIFITSILIALGVNILVNGLVGLLDFQSKFLVLAISGALLVIFALLSYFSTNINKLNKTIKYEGIILLKNDGKEIVSIPSYQVSGDMNCYLKAMFAENKAAQKIWDSDNSLHKLLNLESSAALMNTKTTDVSLLHELIEYCVIEQLSLTLSTYFDNSNLERIDNLDKKDVPDILLNNRFLKQFSEDMSNRELFYDFTSCSNRATITNSESEIVYAFHPSGAIYNCFGLTLPKNSKLTRKNNNITIATRMFEIAIAIDIPGYNSHLPAWFAEYYLGMNPYKDFATYKFITQISLKFKKRFIFSAANWSYYNWAMTYIDRLNICLSEKQFFEDINWRTVRTILVCNKKARQSGQTKKE